MAAVRAPLLRQIRQSTSNITVNTQGKIQKKYLNESEQEELIPMTHSLNKKQQDPRNIEKKILN